MCVPTYHQHGIFPDVYVLFCFVKTFLFHNFRSASHRDYTVCTRVHSLYSSMEFHILYYYVDLNTGNLL